VGASVDRHRRGELLIEPWTQVRPPSRRYHRFIACADAGFGKPCTGRVAIDLQDPGVARHMTRNAVATRLSSKR
jgi:hypothetical protein